MAIGSTAKTALNAGLRPLGVQVIHARSTDPAVQTFIPARKTIAAARRLGMSVGDYIDRTYVEPGATADTVSVMLGLAGLADPADRVLEIGPGSGRFMEKVIDAVHPKVYEVYETATDWLPHLRSLPRALIQPCDGRTLSATASESVDLVHSHKLFVYIPFWATVGYLHEMARVVKPGGTVAFDIVTEPCMDERTIDHWIGEGSIYLPAPREWTIAHLADRGLEYIGQHFIAMPPGRSELLVFRKTN
jgi:SAM-dependent methyltransferase